MASSYNRVILMGHLTRDPQVGTLPSGTAVCELGLAANRRWRDRDGVTHDDVLFIDCTAYGKVAETLGRYLKKGRPVHVEGHLKLDRWDQDGQPRSKVRVIIEQFRFVDSDRTAEPSEEPPEARPAADAKGPPAKRRGGRRAAPPVAATAADAGERGVGGDDVPF